ncbi:MAG: LysM peptidoglycan-binding domain-containing protein [Chloroflexi bacterium]|nr:LysM peptidoglycan-binding domain-containing protein [Chloroflexota bacterium]
MSRRVLIGFIILNVIVSLAVAVIVITYDRSRRPDVEPIEGPTQIVILTATPQPGSDTSLSPAFYQSTIDALQGTVNAYAQITAVVALPTQAEAGIAIPDAPTLPSLDPALLPPIPTDLPPGQPSATPADDGCLQHTVESGDTIIGIAQEYGVFPGDILLANEMDENAILNIGDVLIIPTEGCAALFTPTPIPSPSNTPFPLTRVVPTVTLAPASADAQVIISTVVSWGDVNNEMVELRNQGGAINLQSWTLTDEDGNTFRFPEYRMQQESLVRVYTRQGSNTPAALYWGRDTAAWSEGEIITLADDAGQVQATFRVGGGAVPSAEDTTSQG